MSLMPQEEFSLRDHYFPVSHRSGLVLYLDFSREELP